MLVHLPREGRLKRSIKIRKMCRMAMEIEGWNIHRIIVAER